MQEILQYLKGESTGRERNLFERELEGDPFAKEAMEGLEQFSEGQIEEDLLNLHDRLRRRTSRRRRVAWYGMAAAIASILIVGTLFLKVHDFNPAKHAQKSLLEEVPPGEVPEAKKKGATPEPENRETGKGKAPAEMQVPKEEKVQPTAERAVKRNENALREREPVEIVAVEADATEREIVGKVVSADDHSPLPGAAVSVLGDEAVSITDMEGRFSIPAGNDSQSMVVASYTGMKTEEFSLPPGEEAQLALQPEMPAVRKSEEAAKGVTRMKAEPAPDKETEHAPEMEAASTPGMEPPRSPEPAGGYVALYRYIDDNGRFPAVDTSLAEAVVILQFKVTAGGKLQEVIPLSSPGEPFTAEAIRLLKKGPSWIPAFNEQGAIDKEVRLRIVLKK